MSKKHDDAFYDVTKAAFRNVSDCINAEINDIGKDHDSVAMVAIKRTSQFLSSMSSSMVSTYFNGDRVEAVRFLQKVVVPQVKSGEVATTEILERKNEKG